MLKGWVIAAVVLAALAVGAQEPQEPPQKPTFSSSTDLVVLHVMVKDRQGAYVTDLQREAFTVMEDGQPQTIHAFSDEDDPVTVGLVVDDSGSMWANRERVIAAATAF